VRFEKLEVPAIAVATSAFVKQAEYQSKQLGCPDAQVYFVPHPVSNCTDAQLKMKAESAVVDLVEMLQGKFVQTQTLEVGASECTS